MLLRTDAPCPCGSQKPLSSCCLPEHFPITRRGEGFERITIQASVSLSNGLSLPLPPGMTVESTLRNPLQLDRQIMDLMEVLVEKVSVLPLDPTQAEGIAVELLSIDDGLHAARYHQHQCLRRLYNLYMDNLFVFRPPSGNVSTFIDDMPFRFELEAFVIRTRTCLDILGRLCSTVMWNQPGSWGDFLKKAQGNQSRLNPESRERLIALNRRHSPWIGELRALRNAISHDGRLEGYQALGYQRSRLVEPSVMSSPAEHLCFRSWTALKEIIFEFVSMIVDAKLASTNR